MNFFYLLLLLYYSFISRNHILQYIFIDLITSLIIFCITHIHQIQRPAISEPGEDKNTPDKLF